MDLAHYEGERIDQLTSANLNSTETALGRATTIALAPFLSANSADELRRDEKTLFQTP